MKIFIIGHLCIDEVILGGNVLPISMGGTAAFSSMVCSRLIYPRQVSVISKVGPDFPAPFLSQLAAHNVKTDHITQVKRHSTRYVLNYRNDERELTLKSICEPITWNDFPTEITDADLIYFGPIAKEVPLKTISAAKERTSALIALDIQGLIRKKDKSGILHFQSNSKVDDLLANMDIVKFDLTEAQVVTGASKIRDITTYLSNLGLERFIITRNRQGALLYVKGKLIKIPSIILKSVYNTTGAGDCFFSSFLIEFLKTKEPLHAIQHASKTVAYLIGQPEGIEGFQRRGDIYQIIEEFIAQNQANYL
ncbi:MAG: carbohydrate kinase family protein [Candidatus Helarchaeota archaeon]